jgi:hypothetical protein
MESGLPHGSRHAGGHDNESERASNMKRAIPAMALAVCAIILSPVYGQTEEKPLSVALSPNEVESMLFLYNQTPVKGADVELVAPVGAKLRAGLKHARTQQDSTKAVTVQLLPVEIQVCLGIIQASTFEAKYAELVLGMKRKFESFLPARPAEAPVPDVKSENKR